MNKLLTGILLGAAFSCAASVYVDDLGVMRWSESKKEVCAFGTNYSVPFSYWEQRALIGADYKKAIDEDVYHIARLGLDGYRIHVWDSYISDEAGNLVSNEHMRLFDYLLFRLKQHDIKIFITPMYLGGSGGFTGEFGGKVACLSKPEAFPVMANYLSQFVSHVNPHTGVAYKDDPDIIGFEIVNEPQHWKRPDLTTGYIDRMINSIRDAGCSKPLFYNMTSSAAQIDRILPTKVDGGTFQWYPTGLTANHDQKGNLLPNVDSYHIPFADLLVGKLPKFIYEFSPSDVGDSAVMYPAMARSFREAGFQFAAHFAYDPMHAAYCNIEYRTHFLNLAYTPKKAIGLMIAAEAFRRIPQGKSFGKFPDNSTFDAFRIDYENDLAEMMSDTKFIYSHTTESTVPNLGKLEQVAGVGNSQVISYEGNGAYFLDRLEEGVWRLEVMPDAVWVRDPFFVPDYRRECAVVKWNKHPMSIRLPDLGNRFFVSGLNDGNDFAGQAEQGAFTVSPGTYLLSNRVQSKWKSSSVWRTFRLGEFHAPVREMARNYLLHNVPEEIAAGTPLHLVAQVVGAEEPDCVELVVLGVGGGKVCSMHKSGPFSYEVLVPPEFTEAQGVLRYNFSVQYNDICHTWPGGKSGSHILSRRIYSDDRLLDDDGVYEIRVVDPKAPVVLFDATRDWRSLSKMNRKDRIDCFPASVPGKHLIHLKAYGLEEGEHDFSVRSFCGDTLEYRSKDIQAKTKLEIYGHALNGKPCKVQVALVMKNGQAYGAIIDLLPGIGTSAIELEELTPVPVVLLPRAYPKFQDYWFQPSGMEALDLSAVESVQISIGPGLQQVEWNAKHGVGIGWILLK